MNEIDIVVKSTNKAKLDELRTDAKRTGDQVGDSLKKGFKEVEQASDKARREVKQNLDKTAKDAKDAGEEAGGGFGESFGGTLKDTLSGGGGAQDMLGGLLGGLKGGGALATAGAGMGLALLDGIRSTLEAGDLGGELAASIGGMGDQAARLGQLAGDVYADNFGDSLRDAADGIKAIMQNQLLSPAATDEAIRSLTGKVMTASKVVGDEANNIARAARQMLVNGLAQSADEAFDIIIRATQNGLNVNEDLIETLVEYGPLFRGLGLSGEEAMGLIGQAMKGGARDTDFAADALKEFQIRAQDMSNTTARGFQTIGLDAESMGQRIAAGGSSANGALAETLAALRNMNDPIMRNQAAVDLFGAKAEDLGKSLFSMDLNRAAEDFGDFADAAEKAGDSLETPGQKVEEFGRKAKDAAAGAAAFTLAVDQASRPGGDFQGLTDLVQGIFKYGEENDNAAQAAEERAEAARNAWQTEQAEIEVTVESMDTFIDKQREAMGGVLDLSEAQIGYQEALAAATKSLQDNNATLDIHTEAGRENREALNDIAEAAYDQIEAMERSGATTQELAQFTQVARDEFVHMATRMGLSADQANHLADQLRLIPGEYIARVQAETESAAGKVRNLRGDLIDLTNRDWVTSVRVVGGHVTGGRQYLAHGGIVGASHAAEGGPRGNHVVVGEQGPELVDLPAGSMVHSNPDTERMIAGWMGGGGGPIDIRLIVGSGATGGVAELISNLFRTGQITLEAAGARVQVVG